MRSLMRQTENEKAGSIDGLGLFFGALLGANLGSVESLDSESYFLLILMLAGTVVTIQMAVRSERRGYALGAVVLYAGLILWMVFGETRLMAGVPAAMREKLGITLALWTGMVLLIGLWPASTLDTPRPAEPEDQAGTGRDPRTGRADGSSAS